MRFTFLKLQILLLLSAACFALDKALPHELASIYLTLRSAELSGIITETNQVTTDENGALNKLLALFPADQRSGADFMKALAGKLLYRPSGNKPPGDWNNDQASIDDLVTDEFKAWVLNGGINRDISLSKLGYGSNEKGPRFKELIRNMVTVNYDIAKKNPKVKSQLQKNYEQCLKSIGAYRFDDWKSYFPVGVLSDSATFESLERSTTSDDIKKRVRAVANWLGISTTSNSPTKSFPDFVNHILGSGPSLESVELRNKQPGPSLNYKGVARGAGHFQLIIIYTKAHETFGIPYC